MTPNDIEVLIHCYVSPKTHPRYDAPAVKDSIAMLSNMGLIEHTGLNIFNATARGVAHIQQLCNIGLPVQKWVGADGKEIQVGCLTKCVRRKYPRHCTQKTVITNVKR